MIQFRYGKRAAVAAGAAATAVAAATSFAAAGSISALAAAARKAMGNVQIPSRFGPRPVSAEEMECVRLGGAVDPIGFKPAKKEARKK